MAYDPDRNYAQPPVNEYHRTTTVEREGSGATWIVIGLLFAAIVAAIFFLFRPADTAGGDTIILDPTVSEAPASAPAADVDVNVAPSVAAPADDAVVPDAAPADAAPAETAPAN